MGDELELLNIYTREVLAQAATIAADLPPGWSVKVAADSDLVLGHERSGHWLGVRMYGIGRPVWREVRGSLFVEGVEWPSLSALVDDIGSSGV